MSSKEDEYDANSRQRYLSKRRNATPHFTYNQRRGDDLRPGTSGTTRSQFDHTRIDRGSVMKHGKSRFGSYNRNQSQLTRTIINTIKDDEVMNDAIKGTHERKHEGFRSQSNTSSRYKYSSAGFGARRQPKPPVTRLAIGDTNETKPLVPTNPYCKLAIMDQGIFDIIVKFTQQFFDCYDNNRDNLLAAYHSNAFYSMSLNLKSEAAVKAAKFEESYFDTGSRNLNFVREEKDKFRMLHRGNFDIVASIKKMPYTEHDSNSLRLDCGYFQPNMIAFSVTGVFREGKPDNSLRPYRNFQRTLICVPAANNKMAIVNEQYTISNITLSQSNFYKSELSKNTQMATETVQTSVSNEEQMKSLMIQEFAKFSGLNKQWSNDILEHSGWILDVAQKNFLDHKNEIPKEAYILL